MFLSQLLLLIVCALVSGAFAQGETAESYFYPVHNRAGQVIVAVNTASSRWAVDGTTQIITQIYDDTLRQYVPTRPWQMTFERRNLHDNIPTKIVNGVQQYFRPRGRFNHLLFIKFIVPDGVRQFRFLLQWPMDNGVIMQAVLDDVPSTSAATGQQSSAISAANAAQAAVRQYYNAQRSQAAFSTGSHSVPPARLKLDQLEAEMARLVEERTYLEEVAPWYREKYDDIETIQKNIQATQAEYNDALRRYNVAAATGEQQSATDAVMAEQAAALLLHNAQGNQAHAGGDPDLDAAIALSLQEPEASSQYDGDAHPAASTRSYQPATTARTAEPSNAQPAATRGAGGSTVYSVPSAGPSFPTVGNGADDVAASLPTSQATLAELIAEFERLQYFIRSEVATDIDLRRVDELRSQIVEATEAEDTALQLLSDGHIAEDPFEPRTRNYAPRAVASRQTSAEDQDKLLSDYSQLEQQLDGLIYQVRRLRTLGRTLPYEQQPRIQAVMADYETKITACYEEMNQKWMKMDDRHKQDARALVSRYSAI